ncbi:MAG: TIGR00341 family protein [Pontixanthobacter sp.]
MASPDSAPVVAANDLSFARVVYTVRHWWRESVIGTIDQAAVIEKRRAEGVMSARYMFMTAMSGGIAILGLLLSSPAVVIGAMLLSPLMDPIMGLGFALAIGDYQWLRKSAKSLAWGTLMAVGLCSFVVFFSPLQELTAEIASRTRPNLFDLLVALFSALAGAYAMIRGREGTIVGVAIATALMPPLAVVGYGLATWNWTVFSGALLLYITNLMTIALTAALMARLYGFRTALSERQTQLQNVMIVVVFVALAVPLAFSLRQIAWEANGARQVRGALLDQFGTRSRLSDIKIDWDADPIAIDATVMTPSLQPQAESNGSRTLTRQLGSPVALTITQFQVGTSASAAEQAQLSAAKVQQENAAAQQADQLADRLALVAGVSPDEVTVDRQRRRAVVRAKPLDGASLSAYAELERRISAGEPDWNVQLIPPARALPRVSFEKGEPTESGTAALKLIAWAANRVGSPIDLTGPSADAERTQALLLELGVTDVQVTGGGSKGSAISARWGVPGS